MGKRDQYQSQGAAQAPSTSLTGNIGLGHRAGRDRAQCFQAESSGQVGQMTCYHCRQPRHMRRDCPRRQKPHGTEAEHANQPDVQGTFYTCVCFLMHHVH